MTFSVTAPGHLDHADSPAVVDPLPRTRWAALAHYGVLVVGLVGITGLLRGTWFRLDDFEFLSNRVGDGPLLGIWQPHNEHWSTGPILVWRALYDVFGVEDALPYFACAVLAHVLVAHFLWRLMNRAGANPWVSTGLATVFVFLGTGFENITWAFQLGFMGSVALGLAAALLCLRDGRLATIGAIACLVVSLTFADIGVPFAASAALCLVLRRRFLRAVATAVVPGAVYAAWYVLVGHAAVSPPHPTPLLARLSSSASWAWGLLTSAVEGLTSLAGAGSTLALVVLALIGARLRRSLVGAPAAHARETPLPQEWVVVLPLLANLVFQAASLAVFRSDISSPASSRYLYIVLALLLPALVMLLSELSYRTHRLVAVAVVAYLVITQGVGLLASERQFENPQLRADVFGLAWLVEHQKPITETIAPAPYLHEYAIQKWLAEGALTVDPDLPAQTVLDASVVGQVAVSDAAGSAAVGQVQVAGQSLGIMPGACGVAAAPPFNEAGLVTLSPGQTVSVTLHQPGTFLVQVVEGDRTSRARSMAATPNVPQWLEVTSPLTLRVSPDAGQAISFCNPGPTATG